VKATMGSKMSIATGSIQDTPLGILLIAASQRGLVSVEWQRAGQDFSAFLRRLGGPVHEDEDAVKGYGTQLLEYLRGKRTRFRFSIDWSVLSAFQRRVLVATYQIPYGQTRTYQQIAEQLRNPHAARAVGRAQATNPMPLVIPCHRVVGTDGKLHGYGGGEGIRTKEWLLAMERRGAARAGRPCA